MAWAVVVAMAVVLVTQFIGWAGRRLVVTLQAGTPYLFAVSIPLAISAAATGRWVLVIAAASTALGLAALGWPFVRSSGQRPVNDVRPILRIFHGNLLYRNTTIDGIAAVVVDLDADLLAFTEYTPEHQATLLTSRLVAAFPNRVENPEPRAGGSALWSRYPLIPIPALPALYRSTAAFVEAFGGFAVAVVHPPNPLPNLPEWRNELADLARLYEVPERPAIIVGDLNATPWHPPFRRVLSAGWRDAHQVTARGFSGSWPSDKWWMPPMLRLDHLLVDDTFVVEAVVEVDLPGSDHRGFVVTLSIDAPVPAGRAAHSRRPPEAMDGSSTDVSPPPVP